jgi:hypothetical protein
MSKPNDGLGSLWQRSFVTILLVGLLLQSVNSVFAQMPLNSNSTANQIAPLAMANPVQDPSFEASLGSTLYWAQSSTNFTTPLCTTGICGTGGGSAAPRSGSIWGWFGGTPNNETGSLSQSVTIPTQATSLRFYFWIGSAQPGSDASDAFYVYIDGNLVFTANATQISSYSSYTPISVNINPYSDGNSHTILFTSTTTGQGVNFNLDDVSITDESFLDVPTSHPYYQDIEILFANGFTGGCSTSPQLFCPETNMNRAMAAVFLLRGLQGTSYVPPSAPYSPAFGDDFSPGTWAQPWVQGMLAQGLTAGCSTSPLLYCPWEQMNRAQAAVFGMRLKEGPAYPTPVGTGTVFADVNATEWYSGWVEQAYLNGLLPACGSSGGQPLFCPNSLVSRGLGAYMIVRARNLTMP